MTLRLRLAAFVGALTALAFSQPAVSAGQNDEEGLGILLGRIEQVLRNGDAAAYFDLLTPSADRERAETFASLEAHAGATAVVVKERDRQPLDDASGIGFALMLDTFVEYGNRARVATWQIAVRKVDDVEWRIADQVRLSSVDSLFRLAVDRRRQFTARNFKVTAEDLELTLTEGSAFLVNADDQASGLVLMGRGVMRFRPTPETEQAQVKIFAGSETLETGFDAVYVRTADIDQHVDRSRLVETAVDPRELRRAEEIFREESVKTYVLDLGDLSANPWSLMPALGDFLSEVRTRRFGTLTYVHASAEPEDIFVMDRSRVLNVAVYASQQRVAMRGRFYDENAADTYDVLDYDVDVDFLPDRLWIEGRTRMRIRARGALQGQLNVKLADSFMVRSVISDKFGRLFSLRARGMNVMVVHIPEVVPPGTELTLTIAYGGRLEPQAAEREGITAGSGIEGQIEREPWIPLASSEPSYLYSSRSFWYAQSPVSNYATASIRVSVPEALGCVASGEPLEGFPRLIGGQAGVPRRRLCAFRAERPIRYLSFLATRLTSVERATVTFDDVSRLGSSAYGSLNIYVEANPLQSQRARQIAVRAANIARFYRTVAGDSPYSSFTAAVVENDRPGGHSPAHFATLNQPPPDGPLVWRNDPVDFGSSYPEFFLAHELAHQWWGQGVGWNSYHEQWLSEGIAQYFAALYAEHEHGDEVFARMLRQMRSWAIQQSDQGPVFLGYRIGHVKDDSRIFRALVYNKGALVMHMLRRLAGDEAFFRGLRRFYADSRYRKTSTENLRMAMEAETGRPLERFFERWIYGSTLPDLAFAYRVEDSADGQYVVLRVTQTGELFDVPVAVRLQYTDGRTAAVIVPVADRSADVRVKLEGRLRSATINNDDGTLAEIRRTAF
jgi:hypothetical protein